MMVSINLLSYRIQVKSQHIANQPAVGWLEGLWHPQPTRVQILVLAFIPEFISGFSVMRIQWDKTGECMRVYMSACVYTDLKKKEPTPWEHLKSKSEVAC